MEIKTSTQGQATVLAVTGSMDAITVAEFDAEWKKILEGGAKRLVVDMSGLTYISSAGLRGILMLAKSAKASQADLKFAGMQSMVADMFRLSGFYSILSCCERVEDAL